MSYKDVFQLAKSKGYDSIIVFIARYGGDAMLPREVTNEAEQLCELMLIQKWLRDTHKIYVDPTPYNAVSIYGRNFKDPKWVQVYVPTEYDEKSIKFDTYESTLLEGINAALTLI
jgi:hypothetical protein